MTGLKNPGSAAVKVALNPDESKAGDQSTHQAFRRTDMHNSEEPIPLDEKYRLKDVMTGKHARAEIHYNARDPTFK